MKCEVCKIKQQKFIYQQNINLGLAKSWGLSQDEVTRFNHRESTYCLKCGCSLRTRSLAKAIMQNYPESKAEYFVDWVEWARCNKLDIA